MVEANIFVTVGALLCPLSLVVLLSGLLVAIGKATREGMGQLKRMHSIPCNHCVYFTGCHYLKCTVHPCRALTEDAVECLDFEPVLYGTKSCCTKRCKG